MLSGCVTAAVMVVDGHCAQTGVVDVVSRWLLRGTQVEKQKVQLHRQDNGHYV